MSASTNSLRSAFRTQTRIIGALLMREVLTRYGRHNIGFMWIFVEPMFFTLGVLAIWTIFHLHKTDMPIVPFTLSGYASVLLWRNTISRCGNAVEPNRALMHHRNVRVIDLFLTRIILEIAGASISFIILSVIFVALNQMPVPQDILEMLGAWFLLAWFSLDLALLVGCLSVHSETFERVWHVIAYLYLPVCGAFFMVDWLPSNIQHLALLVPTVDCTEILREGIFGASAHAHYNLSYTIVFDLVMMLPGLLLLKPITLRIEGE